MKRKLCTEVDDGSEDYEKKDSLEIENSSVATKSQNGAKATAVCIEGKHSTINRIIGRSRYIDAILEDDPQARVAFNRCDHAGCVLPGHPSLNGQTAGPFIKYLSGDSNFLDVKNVPLRDLLFFIDYFNIPLQAFASSALERFGFWGFVTMDDYVVVHQKRLHEHVKSTGLFGFDDLETIEVFNVGPVVTRWPFASAIKLYAELDGFDLDELCNGVMREPGIGTLLERLALVRRLLPTTVALLELPHDVVPLPSDNLTQTPFVLGDKCAHSLMVELLGEDFVRNLPASTIVAGGSLVCHLASAPWLDKSDIDIFVPTVEDATIVSGLLEKMAFLPIYKYAFAYEAPLTEASVLTWEKDRKIYQVICSNIATSPLALLTSFSEDYVQIAWQPAAKKVLATLDCWRALLTRKCRVVSSGSLSDTRVKKLYAKGFTVTKAIKANFVKDPWRVQELIGAPPTRDHVVPKFTVGDFCRRNNYNYRDDVRAFGKKAPIWPSTPVELLKAHKPHEEFKMYKLKRNRVHGPSLVSPIVRFHNSLILFDQKWSAEHNNFARIIDWIYSQLGAVTYHLRSYHIPASGDVAYALPTDTSCREGGSSAWCRIHFAPIYKNDDRLHWAILSIVQQPRSPFSQIEMRHDDLMVRVD